MKKIYLSAPDVFITNVDEIQKEKKEFCKKYGFEGIFPSENLDMEEVFKMEKEKASKIIFDANIMLMNQCDIIVANISPFRGWSMDVGVSFELGYFKAQNKPAYAYTNTDTMMVDRIQNKKEGLCPEGFVVEDFNGEENLMVTHTAKQIFFDKNSNPKDLSAMDSFKKAIKNLDL